MLNVLQDSTIELVEPVRPLRIAWSLKPLLPLPVDREVRAALHDVVRRLDRLGHQLVHADPRHDGLIESFTVRYAAGAAADLAALADPSVTERRTRAVAALGRRLSGRPLVRARRLGDTAAARLDRVPAGADVLLTPTVPTPAPPTGSMTGLRTLALAAGRVPFCTLWNVTGQPALSIPAGFTSDGMPLGVQLVGPPGSDALLLSLATQLEQPVLPRPAL